MLRRYAAGSRLGSGGFGREISGIAGVLGAKDIVELGN